MLSPRVFLIAGAALAILGGIGLLAGALVLRPYRLRAAEYDLAEVRKVETESVVYDRNGEVLGSLFTENRRPVSLDGLPNHLLQAVIATEDSRFYEHGGVDLTGILRAAISNMQAGRIAQGASTITQQLARQTFEMRELSYRRKLTEMYLAIRIEDEYSKSEILQHYLNLVYFGNGFYGIESAAQGYFGKRAAELSLSESAVLSGMIKRPNAYNPFKDIALTTGSRNRSLERMYDLGMITEEVYADAVAEPVTALLASMRTGKGLHIMAEIRRRLDQIFADSTESRDGIRIYTTIDANLERKLRDSISRRLTQYEKAAAREGGDTTGREGTLEAAGVIIRNSTGELLASVGGRNFGRSEFDRAFRAKRAMGTAFTPFVYAAAIEKGIDPYAQVLDAPLDNREVMIGALEGIVGEWGAEDPDNEYQGNISGWKAIVSSKNSATVRLGQKVGTDEVLQFAAKAGITSELRNAPSTFLGQAEVSPAELTLAYSTFPNRGLRAEKIKIIFKVVNENEEIIYEDSAMPVQVTAMKPLTAGHVHSALVSALERGTGATSIKDLGLAHMPAGGKTGTAYNFTDAWFLGYNSEVTCGVWAGYDNPQTIGPGAYGGVLALPVWVDGMNASIEKYPPDQVPPPPLTEPVFVCDYSGKKSMDYCTESRLVPAVSDEPIFIACAHRVHLPAGQAGILEPCTYHSADDMPEGSKIASLSPGRSLRAMRGSVPPVYPKSPTLVGDDPYGSRFAVQVQRAVAVIPEPEAVSAPEVLELPVEAGAEGDYEFMPAAKPPAPGGEIRRAVPVRPSLPLGGWPEEEVPRARPVPAYPPPPPPPPLPAPPPGEEGPLPRARPVPVLPPPGPVVVPAVPVEEPESTGTLPP